MHASHAISFSSSAFDFASFKFNLADGLSCSPANDSPCEGSQKIFTSQ